MISKACESFFYLIPLQAFHTFPRKMFKTRYEMKCKNLKRPAAMTFLMFSIGHCWSTYLLVVLDTET